MMEIPAHFLRLVCFLFFMCSLQVSGISKEGTYIIDTGLGLMRGLKEDTNIAGNEYKTLRFLGVPFSSPRIGSGRFRKPLILQQWSQVYDATHYQRLCVQDLKISIQYDGNPFHAPSGEDCLYLNIWLPWNTSDSTPIRLRKLPILFWIPGGEFPTYPPDGNPFSEYNHHRFGTIFDPKALAGIGNIIVVTTNYRTGYLGFLSNNKKTAPGNQGIWDVYLALRWVHDYIELFGGDKDSITIGGHDAGAVIVSLISVSPLFKGLYKRRIVQSGSAMAKFSTKPTSVIEQSENVSRALCCSNENHTLENDPAYVLYCMRRVKANELIDDRRLTNPYMPYNIFPTHSEDLFPHNPRFDLLEGKFHSDTDLLIGTSGNEGLYSLVLAFPKTNNPYTNDPHTFGWFGDNVYPFRKGTADSILLNFLSNFGLRTWDGAYDDIVEHFLPEGLQEPFFDWRYMVAEAIGEFLFVCPTIYYAMVSSKAGANVYFYDFQHRPSTSPWAKWVGPTHFDDVKFFFGDPLIKTQLQYTQEEKRLSRKMVDIWVNFIKNGKPGNYWPKYGKTAERMVLVNDRTILKSWGPHHDNCRYWFNFIYPNRNTIYANF